MIKDHFPTELSDDQNRALEKMEAFLNSPTNCFLLKGYAGTGKTFLMQGLVKYFKSAGREFILMAPTGRAAMVIGDKTQTEAYTIHKSIYNLQEFEDDEHTFMCRYKLRNNDNKKKVLFIDARNIFRQIDRAHREFTEEHIQNIATIVRLFRGENKRLSELLKKYSSRALDFAKRANEQRQVVDALKLEVPEDERELKRWTRRVEEEESKLKELQDRNQYFEHQVAWINERFPNGRYDDVTGLCKAATLAEIEEQDWSLNPGRYVGVVIEEDGLTEVEFLSELKDRNKQLRELNNRSLELNQQIDESIAQLLTSK